MGDYQILGTGTNYVVKSTIDLPRLVEITRGTYMSSPAPHIALPVIEFPPPYYFTQEYVNTLKK